MIDSFTAFAFLIGKAKLRDGLLKRELDEHNDLIYASGFPGSVKVPAGAAAVLSSLLADKRAGFFTKGRYLLRNHRLIHRLAVNGALTIPGNKCLSSAIFHLELTESCNLRCKHCYVENYTTKTIEWPELERVVDEVFQLYDRGFDSIVFVLTGGEPLLHPKFWEICKHIDGRFEALHRHKPWIHMTIQILSNSVLLRRNVDELEDFLSGKHVRFFWQVSLESPVKEGHESVRGPGTYEPTIEAMRILRNHKVPFNVHMVVTKSNFSHLDEMRTFSRKMGARNLSVTRAVPSTRSEPEEITLSGQEIELLFRFLKKHRPFTDYYRCDSLPAGNMRPFRDAAGCIAGTILFGISVSGQLTTCRRLGIELGRFSADAFLDLQDTPLLWDLRERNHTSFLECFGCGYVKCCTKGAACMAYAIGKDIRSADPQCPYRAGVSI